MKDPEELRLRMLRWLDLPIETEATIPVIITHCRKTRAEFEYDQFASWFFYELALCLEDTDGQ